MHEKPVTILVVDDDHGHAELIRRNLKRSGFANEVYHLENGEAALDFVYRRNQHADRPRDLRMLALLDLNMPGLDGVTVLRTLKSDPEKARIPVIILTTTDDPREVERCYELGCSTYITKPVSPDKFIDAIKRLGLFISVVELPREEGK
jgi:CheY-like chemotaxis protein